MITRAMVLKLVPVIEQIYIDNALQTSPTVFKQAKTARGEENQTDNDLLELMTHERVLLEKIDFKSLLDKNTLALLFYVNNIVVAQAVLNKE
ncbi:MAG: hypothetical protein U9N52_08395, partial [Campylobacterota bacterium]|nr:hypothetical protein [Campylobacterota bacterium]